MATAPAADILEVAAALNELYPEARTELDHRNAFELLVATVLSAQTTDQRVNSLTPELFRRFPDARSLGEAEESDLAELLRPLGMGPTRARRIIALGQELQERHEGVVPDQQEQLEALSGVGRKTALVVRGTWFGHDALAVDTHVARLAGRLGWSRASNPRTVEDDVLRRRDRAAAAWRRERAHDATDSEAKDPDARPACLGATVLSLRLILHGRRVCTARSPHCDECSLAALCPRRGVKAA